MFSELGLLFVIVIVAILLYTSLIFAIETEGPEAWRWSFYDSFWWGLMVLTTPSEVQRCKRGPDMRRGSATACQALPRPWSP